MSEIIEDKGRAPLTPSLLLSISHTLFILEIINPRHSGLDQAHDLWCTLHDSRPESPLTLSERVSSVLAWLGSCQLQLVKFRADWVDTG